MSKLPSQHLWSRATASSSGRTLRAASFGAHHAASRHAGLVMSGFQATTQSSHAPSSSANSGIGSSSASSGLAIATASSSNAYTTDVPGAVSAPFFGPQPRAVVEADALPPNGASPPAGILPTSSSTTQGLSRSNLSLQSQALIPYAAMVNHAKAASATRCSVLLAPQPMRRYFSVSTQASAPGGITSTSAPALPPSGMQGKGQSSKYAMARRQKARLQGVVETSRAKVAPTSDLGNGASIGKASRSAAINRSFIDLLKGATPHSQAGDGEVEQVPSLEPLDLDVRLHAGGAAHLEFCSHLPPELGGPMHQGSHAAIDGASPSSSPSFTPPPSPGPAQTPPARDGNVPSGKSMQPARTTGSSTDGDGASALSSSPPSAPASSSSASAGHQELQSEWERAFNAPRSQRHDYTLEHGAYGIPKRHPLSAITSSSASRTSSKGKGKEQAPRSQLAQMGDFLTGSSAPAEPGLGPVDAVDARRAALSGGSTAQGDEAFWSRAENGAGNRRCIRDADGRVIRDRLRSVQVGEDAYFLRPDSLGIADGVGGWGTRAGADPALFSRFLMHFCAVELSRYDHLSAAELTANNGEALAAWSAIDPVEIMHRAWRRCIRASRREGIKGSSTALIAILREDELRIANVGDCVALVIRPSQRTMVFRSEEQQHSFNYPLQLGMMSSASGSSLSEPELEIDDYDYPEELSAKGEGKQSARGEKDSKAADGSLEWDEPRRDAGRYSLRVQPGDLLIVGSDGCFDNLFDEDVLEEVLRFIPVSQAVQGSGNGGEGENTSSNAASGASTLPADFSPQAVSEALCLRAKQIAEDPRAVTSPFQCAATDEGLHYVGGKLDDVSVLVAVVKGPATAGDSHTLDIGESSVAASRDAALGTEA